MKRLTFKFKIRLSVVVLTVCAALSAFGQTGTKPLLQPIMVYGAPQPQTSATPFVQKTGSSAPAITSGNPVKTSIPILADALIPGVSGVLVETLDGNVVVESGSNQTFNPASNVKIATSYAVMKTFGPEYRFPTNFWTDGTFDQALYPRPLMPFSRTSQSRRSSAEANAERRRFRAILQSRRRNVREATT